MRIKGIGVLVAALTAFTLAGCQKNEKESSPAWREITASSLTDAQKAKVEIAAKARSAAMGTLLNEVKTNMKASGPAKTISVCSEKAQTIIGQVAKTHKVTMGRTSHKLRNPKNVAPQWAQAAVDAHRSEPLYMTNTEGALGVLTSIPTAAPCLKCHGDPASMTKPLKDALAARYPDDRATGFKAGDIRGWFWVQVP